MLGRSSSNERLAVQGEDADGNIELLEEIESLSRALSLPHPCKHKSKTAPASSSQKKPSFWNWKPLKALSHIGQRRFDCVFSLHVHSIENLPTALDGAALSVHWRRTSDPPSSAASTSSVDACDGMAEFDETLTYRCSVYGARKSSGHSAAKYEARNFMIYVSVSNAPELEEFGKQLVDVTRLLPITLEELEDNENISGKWSTSFRLTGAGKGALLNLSFGFSLIRDGFLESASGRKVMDALNMTTHDEDSIGKARIKSRRWSRSQSVEDVRELHEILPNSKSVAAPLADSIEKMEISDCQNKELCDLKVGPKPKTNDFCEEDEAIKPKPRLLIDHFEGNYYSMELGETGIDMVNQGTEISAEDQLSTSIFENINLEIVESCDINCDYKKNLVKHENSSTAMEDTDFVFDVLPVNEQTVWASPLSETMASNPTKFEEGRLQNKSFDQIPFDLSSETDPESPRERLWKQFEKENFGSGSLLFGLESDESEEFDLLHLVYEAERELNGFNEGLSHQTSVNLIEDAETESLMRKWGLNEKEFQFSPTANTNGFDRLTEGLGPVIQTKDGGFLRPMSPALFSDSENDASLVMQISSPVVVPAEMGSGVMEILHRLASVGTEKLTVQAKNLMPLEDVTGKTMNEIAWESAASVDCGKREEDFTISEKIFGGKEGGILNLAPSSASNRDFEYVTVEELAPLAMDKIETLCIEGLKIQSGMSDEEAPSNISSQFIGNGLQGLDNATDFHLLNVKEKIDDVDGLMSLSITLDEWLRLDSGILDDDDDDDDQNDDRTSKILAAHRASYPNKSVGKHERTEGRKYGRRWGLLQDNFTAALMVQLRDPLRNFDPVGTPMLALVQIERVFLPPKPKLYTTVLENGTREGNDGSDPLLKKNEEEEEEDIPQFKITNVHVAGLKTELDGERIWGNSAQQQSGSRWLIANGMGKSNKHPLMKSKASSVTTTVQTGDSLWSISSHFHGHKWKDLSPRNSRVRNPDIKFPKEAMSLR